MGCNRLTTEEDRETLDLAREKCISVKEARSKIVAEKIRSALGQLVESAERMEQIIELRERALRTAGFAITMKNRPHLEMDSATKGLFGEGATALEMFSRGFEPISFASDANQQGTLQPGGPGIDSIWMKDGEFYVVETKPHRARMEKTLRREPLSTEPEKMHQLDEQWILERTMKALGQDRELNQLLLDKGMHRVKAFYDRSGQIDDREMSGFWPH